ncbi:hypothetical protein LTR16_006508, partial [Cryomyces antarcticus]
AETKLAEIPLRGGLDFPLEKGAVLVAVVPLHAPQVRAIPMQAHQARDQQLVAQLVLVCRRGGVGGVGFGGVRGLGFGGVGFGWVAGGGRRGGVGGVGG